MNLLNREELFLLAIELDYPDLLRFCSVNRKINDKICKRTDIWFYKLNKEFPDYKSKIKVEKSPKEIYSILYTIREFLVPFIIPATKPVYIEKYYNALPLEKRNADVYDIYSEDSLYLADNHIEKLPKEIAMLTNLKSLFLNNNKLESIPKEIDNLTNLKYLDLSENKLKTLPKEIGNLINLKYLYLSDNLIDSLPPEIGKLSKLKELEVRINQLTEIPKEIGILSNLTYLNLEYNQIIYLPEEIGNLVSLQNLNIHNNEIGEITKNMICNLTNLTNLDISGNQLSDVPDCIKTLNLNTFYFDQNNFSDYMMRFLEQ